MTALNRLYVNEELYTVQELKLGNFFKECTFASCPQQNPEAQQAEHLKHPEKNSVFFVAIKWGFKLASHNM